MNENLAGIISTSTFHWNGKSYFSRIVDWGEYFLVQIYTDEGPWKDVGRIAKDD